MTSSVDTTTLRALLATIISQPDEDTPRLQYADVLMDSDDVLDRVLGEYIKLSIELHNHKKLVKPRIDTALKNAEFRVEHSAGYKGVDSYDWYRKGIELRERTNVLWQQSANHPSHKEYHPCDFGYEITRGFISSITCTASQFLSICDKLIWHDSMWRPSKIRMILPNERYWMCPLTAHPVREIEVTTGIDRKFPKFTREYGEEYWTTASWPNIKFNLGDNPYGTYVDVEIDGRHSMKILFEAMETIKVGDPIMVSATGRAAKWDSSFQVPSVGIAMSNSYDMTFNE